MKKLKALTKPMKVINWTQFTDNGFNIIGINHKEKKTSMTVGMFDGIHRGHLELIRRIVSHNANYLPVIVTFRQNHKTGKHGSPERGIKHEENKWQKEIQNFQQRLEMFEKLGIQITIAADFTEAFKKMPGIEFLEVLLKNGNPGFFTTGSNFRCGYRLDTDANAIEKFFVSRGIPAEIVPEVMEGALPVSSSRIRTAINDGDITLAQTMLGRKI